MNSAKEWYYSIYVKGMDDPERIYTWFEKMDTYAKFYHLAKSGAALSQNGPSLNMPVSEMISLKEYYDKKWIGASGCRSQGQLDAQKISESIENRLKEIAHSLA